MAKIRVLADDIANRIAAGEVVERPASVVKELMENSLDAGSTKIMIDVEEGGRKLIRITDNGEGMEPEDALACFGRHATSKLYQQDDLFSIKTLGFRVRRFPPSLPFRVCVWKPSRKGRSVPPLRSPLESCFRSANRHFRGARRSQSRTCFSMFRAS
jgi:hypothetical protein